MKKLIFFNLLMILLLANGCKNIERPDQVTITIVETSDVHGAIFNYDFIKNQQSSGSLAQVQSYLNELKDSHNIILVDNGDILQGQPTVYYSNYENIDDTHICAKVMNFMEYDVATIGNHDIEAGHAVYDKLKKEFNFPWLAANAVNTKTGEPYFQPYKVINKYGVKIAVLGLITPGIPEWLPQELWEGIEFNDMVESAKKWVPLILEKEKPDMLIGLFHAGYDYTYGNNTYDTHKNENASIIVAEQVPGFDIIFIGHDHRTTNEKIKNINGDEVLLLGPTSGARQVATAHIDFNLLDNGKYAKSIRSEIVQMNGYKTDSVFNDRFKNEFNDVKNYVSRQVGVFDSTIDAYDAIFGPSVFMDLIHQVQFDITDADVSFSAPLSFRDKIEKGPVNVNDMFKLYRFENFLYTMRMTGEEIDKYLEYSFANWFNTMESPNDHLLLFKMDEDGKPEYSERYQSYSLKTNYYNFDVASGIKYTVSLNKPIGDKVDITSFTNGNDFIMDSTYKVAVNSYRGNGGGGHLVSGAGIPKEELSERRISSTEKDLRYYMMKWIEEKDTVYPQAKNEWVIEPNEWWQKGKQKDKQLLK